MQKTIYSPAIRIVRLESFRAVTSGADDISHLMEGFNAWQEAHMHLIRPMLYGAPDFLFSRGEKMEWIWAVKEGVTEADVQPYRLTEHPGGLYACVVTVDGDDEKMSQSYGDILQWLENSGFAADESAERPTLCHMLHPDKDIRAGLGYDQMEIFVPIRLKAD